MERHYVIEGNRGLAYILIGFAALLIVLSLVLTLGFTNEPRHWSHLFYFFQGASLAVLGVYNLRLRKFYLEWNDRLINYYLPGQKFPRTIQIADIKELKIRLFEIWVQLPGEECRINLENANFKAIKRIKEKFEELKRSLPS